MTITIRLLGPPHAEVDGRPLAVDTRKAIALLAYLATRPGPHTRDHLAGLLWPDLPQERARAVLRRTLSALKAGLGDGAVRADRRAVRLDAEGVELDVARFRALVGAASRAADAGARIEQLRPALALHRGDFLEGFSLRDSDTFEEWQEAEARALRREVSEGLDSLIKAASETGDITLAIQSANQRLRLDPLNEATHRTLMQLHSRAGNRSSAIEQYRECVAVLERELGVEPAGVTTDLYDAIIEDDLEQEPDVAPAPLPEPSRSPIPLVGRDAEISSLVDAFGAARKTGVVVAIDGEAGVGKTRLLEELIARVRPRTIARARGYRSEVGVAYGAITQLLGALVTPALVDRLPRTTVHELARLLPDVGDRTDETDHPAAASRFYEAIKVTIETAFAGDDVGLLAVDDAQWLDAASTGVLSYVLRRLPNGICVVVLWRSQDMSISRQLREAVADRDAVVIQPERLGRDAVAALVRATHPEASDREALTDRLLRETEGLPLFVAEYLTRPFGDGDWSVPSSARSLFQDRIENISDVGRQILGTAALIDRSFDFDTLHRASGRSELETLDALDELSGWGLVRALDPEVPLYEFSHDKLRAAVLEAMIPVRRRVLHRRIAEAMLASEKKTSAVTAAIAAHFEAAGLTSEAARNYRAAGDHARSVFAHRDALIHYEAALGAGIEDPGEVYEAIGDLNVLLGDYARARSAYERAAASPSIRISRIERKLGEVGLRRGTLERARAHLERALIEAGDDRAEILCDLAIVALRVGDVELAEAHVDTAASVAPSAIHAQVRNISGKIAAAAGNWEMGRKQLERSLEEARANGDEVTAISALNNLALLHRERGASAEAIELTTQALTDCRRIGDRHHEAALENNLADLLNATGDREGAMEHLKRATTIFAEISDEPEGPVPEVWKLVDW